MKISIQTTLAAMLLVLCSVFVHAQDCVGMYFDSDVDGDDLVVRLRVDNFEDILTSQFAFNYSYLNLELKSVVGNADIGLNESFIFSEVPGYITVSWSNASAGQTLPNGSVFLEMRFTEIVSGVSEFRIDPNFNIEFVNAFFEIVCFQAAPYTINENRTQLIGKLYHDLNGNCTADPTDLPLSGWTVLVDAGPLQLYRVTDAYGYYSVPVNIGSYTINVIHPNDLWDSCDGPVLVNVNALGEVQENSFVLFPKTSSSALEVTVSSSEIKRCFDNIYSVKYKNDGTGLAQSAKLELEIDENLEYVSNNTGNISIDGKIISFDLGNIKPGDGGDFQVVLNASCDNIVRGQTLCVEARISSSDVVIPPAEWNGAVLTTEVTCESDSVVFTIDNIGISSMISPMDYIVVEDDVMFGSNTIDLDPQERRVIKHAASGGVYRILVDQEDGYPLGKFSTDFIEFCNGGDSETYQYVAMFQNEDESPFRDIECQEVKDEADANNMSAFPVGYREDHLINQNEDIEYTIFFQNVGEDTVSNIYIENRVDESLDMATLIAGSSSHNYTISIKEDRKLRIEFNNIQLPNDNTNEFESRGFIKYRISQNNNVPLGTKINSSSMIFFDLDEGIETNLVSHIVGEQFIEIVLSDKDLLLDNEMIVAPNPAISTVRVELPAEYENLSYVLYDTKGSIMSAANVVSNVFYINRDFIKGGMYFLEIRSTTKILGTKKIVFQD